MKVWKRICPKCNREITYSRKDSIDRANKQNRMCRSCTQKINITKRPPFSDISKQKMSEHRKGKTYKELGINCDLIKRGMSISNSKKGMTFTDIHRLSLRNARIEWLKNNGFIFPTFNKNACDYFDKLNKERGWNLQHALNGGEVLIDGYWIDGYDKGNNIVVEYDESFHNKPCRKQKDIKRMEDIKRYLHCKFYRYDVRSNELKEYE